MSHVSLRRRPNLVASVRSGGGGWRYNATPDLHAALAQRCETVRKPRSTVLFRRGEKAFGMFLILTGTVRLDFGVDGAAGLASTNGPGALVGLPATLTKRD